MTIIRGKLSTHLTPSLSNSVPISYSLETKSETLRPRGLRHDGDDYLCRKTSTTFTDHFSYPFKLKGNSKRSSRLTRNLWQNFAQSVGSFGHEPRNLRSRRSVSRYDGRKGQRPVDKLRETDCVKERFGNVSESELVTAVRPDGTVALWYDP